MAAANALLATSDKPVIIVGHGARFAMDEITNLAERLGAPVLTTFKAKGLIADDHPLGCGVLGRSGTPIASYFMNEADCLLVFAASFSNHTGITPKIPTIQVDFDPMALGRFHAIECPVWGEVSLAARALATALPDEKVFADRRPEVAERWAIWREEKCRRRDDEGAGLNAATVFDQVTKAVDADAVIAVDVGNNTYSFGRYFECQQQSVLMSGYLGSIGFSFPAAMGAWAAVGKDDNNQQEKRQIVSVSGDGGFGQYGFELTTAVKYGMNITHIMLHNGQLGKSVKNSVRLICPFGRPVYTIQILPNLRRYAVLREFGSPIRRICRRHYARRWITPALPWSKL